MAVPEDYGKHVSGGVDRSIIKCNFSNLPSPTISCWNLQKMRNCVGLLMSKLLNVYLFWWIRYVSCKGQKWFLNAESDFRIGRHSLTQNARYTSIASAAAF